MSKWQYVGKYEQAVVAELSPPAKEKLQAWAKSASAGGDGSQVWLCNLPDCKVHLILPDSVLDIPSNWKGDTFNPPPTVLRIEVEAESVDKCHAVLTKCLFKLQPEAGRACFIVAPGEMHGIGDSEFLEGTHGLLVKVYERLPYQKGQVDASLRVEYLCVHLPPEKDCPDCWLQVD